MPLNFSIQSNHQNEENIIWKDDFESGDISGWEIIDDITNDHSNWYIEKGYLIQDTDIGSKGKLIGTNIMNGNSEWGDYIIRTNIVCTDDDFIGILFRYNDNDNYYRLILSSQRKEIRIDKKLKGEFYNLAMVSEEWEYVKFSVTIFLKSENIKIYLNEKQYFDISDNQLLNGKIGFTSISNLGSFFDDITIYSNYQIKLEEIKHKFIRGPYLQSVLGNRAVIMWDTSLPSSSVVEYGLTIGTEYSTVSDELVTKHEVKLEDLKPETVYFYRIKSNGLTSDWYSFKTAVNENTRFSFIAYGDNQMNFLRHSEITSQFSKHDFDFIINCGDVVQYGPRSDWDVEFFEPLENILTSKAIYSAIGNHEQNSENYYKNFSNPDLEHENYYSFKYGNCLFIFIDNPRVAYPHKAYYTDCTIGSPQYKWLESKLSSNEAQHAEWLFVVSHIPSYSAGSKDYFLANKEYLVPLFEKYNVDISFSGHVHGYERGFVNGVNYIITAGGGGAQNKKNLSKLKQVASFKLVYNFCQIDIKENSLFVKVYNNKNELIDELKIVH